ncbi:GTP cyclohydrolase 1 type 2/Nif3 [Sparassis latifolia]|uniref:Protein NIF3 homolog n=1 Tax=Sparassis crispa TaxID=139825 RepID=A0A401G5M8_9APHY|nr:Protein NIF3 homolog [Sparassis crispa]GBE77470.1 Protein NIF3 homolog [Sparassis crispa]
MSVVKHICRALERVAPLRLAEKWDNVGLLLEAPQQRPDAHGVLLTIDLTTAVVDEALSSGTAFIVSYHPPIFKPLTSITLSDPLQHSLLRCAAAGISIYTPHTALDSVTGGINDWLCQVVTNWTTPKEVEYIGDADPEGAGGVGRLIKFDSIPMKELELRIKQNLKLEQIQAAYTSAWDITNVESVAICAGSGSSVLLGVDADVYFTGEMPHHEVLAAVASGRNVILCGHTNTERGYLPMLAEKIAAELQLEIREASPALQTPLSKLQVRVSETDHHPLWFV